MTIVYKYVHPTWAEQFENGDSFILRTLTRYRNLEGERADPMEGIAANIHPEVKDINPITHPDLCAKLAVMGVRIGPGANVSFGGGIVAASVARDHLIFCASLERDPNQVENGNIEFEIQNFEEFCRNLGAAMNASPENPVIHKCVYTDRVADMRQSGLIFANPFAKPTGLAWENEIRAAWPVQSAMGVDEKGDKTLASPGAAQFVRRLTART